MLEPSTSYKALPYTVHWETLLSISHALSEPDLLEQLTNVLQSTNTDSGPWLPFSRKLQSSQIAYASSRVWLAIGKII